MVVAHMSSLMTSDASRSNDESGRVLQFERRNAAPDRQGAKPQIGGRDQSPVAEIREYAGRGGDDDDYRHRMKMNAVALTVLVLLVVCGLWIADTIAEMRKNQDCVLSGRRACAPIDLPLGRAN
jgi:hypothetical protein